MTAKELIEQLQKLPSEIQVFTKGYEGGLCDCNIVELEDIVNIALDFNDSTYFGPHEELDNDFYIKRAKERNLTVVKGVVL